MHPHISPSQNSSSNNEEREHVNPSSKLQAGSNCGVKPNDSNVNEKDICQVQSTSEKTSIRLAPKACATKCKSTYKSTKVQPSHVTARKSATKIEMKQHPIQESKHNAKELRTKAKQSDCAEDSVSSIRHNKRNFASYTNFECDEVTNELTGSSLHETDAASRSNDSSMSSTDLLYRAMHNNRSLYDSVSSSSIETLKQPIFSQDSRMMIPSKEGRNKSLVQSSRKRKRNVQITAQDQSVSSLNSSSSSSSELLLANTQCYDSSSSSVELL